MPPAKRTDGFHFLHLDDLRFKISAFLLRLLSSGDILLHGDEAHDGAFGAEHRIDRRLCPDEPAVLGFVDLFPADALASKQIRPELR